jgi:protocatechuate 4,5-dioxygenase, alpha chain
MRNDTQGVSSSSSAHARKASPPEHPTALARGRVIAGTPTFDGERARRGYALNRLCFSLNERDNRDALLRDEAAYCHHYGLNRQQTEAIRSRNIEALLNAGGNIYYLAKLAGCFGMNVQDMGAQQTGMSVEAFRAKLRAAGSS